MADKPRFWSDAKVEPKRSFRWYFLLSGDNEQIETYAIKTVKKPSFAVTEVPHQYVAHTFYFPGRVTWNTVDVTFVDPVIPDQSAAITNMFIGAGYRVPKDRASAETSLSKQGFVDSIGSPQIVQIDADGQPLDTWTLNNAFFTSVDYGQLDYSSEDLVITSVTLRYDFATMDNTTTPSSQLTP
jgi:hypothetical protein